MASEVVHFDADNSIIVFNYLTDYRDLDDFYLKENIFPSAIATVIGKILATIHRSTLDHREYRDFFVQNREDALLNQTPNVAWGLEQIGLEIFGLVPADGLKFFALYQRYDSLRQAITELATAVESCCLTHNDLKLNNILLRINPEQNLLGVTQTSDIAVRLIDWERCSWEDPAFDLGKIIASYLQIWLNSLVINPAFDIQESLRLAIIPLEQLQPSIAALAKAYFQNFPQIVKRRPEFLKRVVQFSGLALIQQIQVMLQYQKSFGNTGICMLQVAESVVLQKIRKTLSIVVIQFIVPLLMAFPKIFATQPGLAVGGCQLQTTKLESISCNVAQPLNAIATSSSSRSSEMT